MASKGTATGLVALGTLLAWSGLRGASITGSLRDLISGKQPKIGTRPITPVSDQNAASSPFGTASESGIASDALQYRGIVRYKWAGATPNGWDCSGMVNYVLGHDLGIGIPGHPSGQFSGHGPATMQYYLWTGAKTIPQSQATAGDLVCFLTHIGIAISNDQMISALNPQLGTAITTFNGARPLGEPMRIRRIL